MSTYTTHYNLKKPEGGDAVNIADINGNMDTVDEQLKANADGLLQVYTKAEMDAFINTINGNISTGDAARYTKTESDARYSQSSHTHDSRYYTESEMDTKLSNKSDTSHNHDSRYPLIGHTHDERYYTEAEIDAKYSAITATQLQIISENAGYYNSHSIYAYKFANLIYINFSIKTKKEMNGSVEYLPLIYIPYSLVQNKGGFQTNYTISVPISSSYYENHNIGYDIEGYVEFTPYESDTSTNIGVTNKHRGTYQSEIVQTVPIGTIIKGTILYPLDLA